MFIGQKAPGVGVLILACQMKLLFETQQSELFGIQ